MRRVFLWIHHFLAVTVVAKSSRVLRGSVKSKRAFHSNIKMCNLRGNAE